MAEIEQIENTDLEQCRQIIQMVLSSVYVNDLDRECEQLKHQMNEELRAENKKIRELETMIESLKLEVSEMTFDKTKVVTRDEMKHFEEMRLRIYRLKLQTLRMDMFIGRLQDGDKNNSGSLYGVDEMICGYRRIITFLEACIDQIEDFGCRSIDSDSGFISNEKLFELSLLFRKTVTELKLEVQAFEGLDRD
ncbi:unnamed protein product [Bursaphelenchus okinawaensis]|uniref:Uncharacterized protein n=1 Tax=Bursaphelenchus okinawaensis TaxID=465554 RepID=A0A811LM87_9BILA|nr:unnamed protein product [Bursaphelenchus okinawaensis]CAG9126554.1 unnamed protein product [Bursaphelenchus okinawaensis]